VLISDRHPSFPVIFVYGHSCDQITEVIQFFQATGLAFQDRVLKSSLGIER
jgi:hypothetical protein